MRKKNTYQLISYDVWGNERDGFDVNAAYTTGTYVDLPEEATDRQIISILKREGLIRKGVWTSSIEIEGDDEYSLYFRESRSGRPIFELRREEG